ncbi:hypothetical protein PR048_024390 [Dryococelus australis]|uniref:Transposase n=1 Tax=Dryococelus australis TaxID=614101 RepID=A0ABQ9GNG6_9NEOP|nr:hypothetical protein PR048_024390 [Dryococelus australis]
MFARNPTLSSCTARQHLSVSHSLILTILHDDGLYPYRYSAIHHLMEGYRLRRLEYCQGMLTSLQHDPDFMGHILWMDEAQFYPRRHIKLAQQPPLASRGTYLLPDTLTGRMYAVFLSEILTELLEDIPLAVLRVMWYQHDKASPHYSRAACRELITSLRSGGLEGEDW